MSEDCISKICNRCKISKPTNEFYRNKKHADGYQYCCKVCDDLGKKKRRDELIEMKLNSEKQCNMSLYCDTEEIWKDFPSDVRYEISSKGRVRNKSNYRIIKPSVNKNGYLVFVRYLDGKFSGMYIHQAVAQAFIGCNNDKLQVSHLDGNNKNNTVENLAYEDVITNIHRKFEHGTMLKGEEIKTSKLTESQVADLRKMYSTGEYTYIDLSKVFGISAKSVGRVINYETWKHLQ